MKIFRKYIVLALMVVAFSLVIFKAGMVAGAQNGTPGSINDPLITKSYLDERLAQLGNTTGSTGTSVSGGMVRVEVSKNDIISGKAGTVYVLMEGSASVSGNSIVNITIGERLNDGMTVSKYNSFLCTDDKGAVRADSNAVIFVSGSYELVKSDN